MTNDLTKLYGKRVGVYRNLHMGRKLGRKVYSVVRSGKVVAHVEQILLTNVEFKVRANGRDKVRQTKRKNVHAFVVGDVVSSAMGIGAGGKLAIPTTYNPYEDDHFVTDAFRLRCWGPRMHVFTAQVTVLNQHGCSAAYLEKVVAQTSP
jgi:hypothetical protein